MIVMAMHLSVEAECEKCNEPQTYTFDEEVTTTEAAIAIRTSTCPKCHANSGLTREQAAAEVLG